MINQLHRYQTGLKIKDLFPTRKDGLCSCGCGKKLSGRKKRWYSKECSYKALIIFYIVKGDNKAIRDILYSREKGFCRSCGVYDENWQADHIIPVYKGGGACGIENFQTLCSECHKEKTSLDRIPYSHNVLATSLNVLPPTLDAIGALNDSICKNIIRNAI